MAVHILLTLALAYYLLVIGIAVGVILDNRSPAKTLAYLLVLLFVPVIGLVVYYMFGQNLRKQKLFSRKAMLDNATVKQWQSQGFAAFKTDLAEVQQLLGEKIKVVNLLQKAEHSVVTQKNEVEVLFDGQHIFPRLFADMRAAKHHLHIEFYIIDDDVVGREFKEILIQKATAGVQVRLCYDDVGSRKLPNRYLRELKQAGVEVYPFMRVFWPYLTSRVNFRNHRKIVVIDGAIGYFGGINIADRYTNANPNLRYWRDTHMRVAGEAVKYLQMQFLLNWKFVAKHQLPISKKYFPESVATETHRMQIVSSGPDSDWPSIMHAILMAISTAERYVYITTPYFIPNDEILTALQTAAMAGIDVQVLMPKRGDGIIVHAAGMSYVRQLLEAGVQVYWYKKGFVHSKTIVVDDAIASVGTTNMDNRSFELNFELNAFIYDAAIARQLKAKFIDDKTVSDQASLKRWEKRRRTKRITESFARMFAPLL
jgi:cardiolipin synthase